MNLETIAITDAASGTTARVLPAVGFNCYSFTVAGPSGPLEVLWTAPDFLAGQGKPSHSGIPILFPFAGRLRGTSFQYDGRTYELAAGDGQGNAIHGFVLNRPWRVTEQAADRVTGTFQASVDDSSLAGHWPADFRITASYRVSGRSLVADYSIDNPDQTALPFGFGTHPYFRVPLGGTSADACRVTVPVEYGWELKALLPTGRKTAQELAARLAGGMDFGGMKLDNVFGGVGFDNHRATASVRDPQSATTMKMTFDDRFGVCVVYNPPHREAVCIEPYTTLPDAFAMHAEGIDPHLQVLPPGATFTTRIEISVE